MGDTTIVTVEPGTCMVFDPNTTNAYIMDGNSDNANAIWLRNWREVGLENARKTGGWCIQVLVAGGMSEMQRAEESMARSEGVPVIKLHLDKERVYSTRFEPYLKALLEAMKTKPKAEKRTMTYYPEAVVLTKDDLQRMQRQAEADAMFAEIDTDGDGFLTREEVIVYITTKQGGTEEEANGTFDQLDTDKDGKLSKEEFRAAF